MQKITSLKDLNALKAEQTPLVEARYQPIYSDVTIPEGKKCVVVSASNKALADAFTSAIAELKIDADVLVSKVGLGCDSLIMAMPNYAFYRNVTVENAKTVAEMHLKKNERAGAFFDEDATLLDMMRRNRDGKFSEGQMRIALRNCGMINPESIEEYIVRDGYQALAKVLSGMKPEDVVKEIKLSGLRGRGGGGFPTGLKWEIASKHKSPEKFMICNADEGDPGAFMDRSVMEGDPHTVLEAMAIGAYAIGANKGTIYIRAEYPLAIERLEMAIEKARAMGFLGQNIFGSDFSFDLELKLGAGAFVCGEETALIHSIEGERGEPTTKPPFPAECGLWQKPSNVNNVETFANITSIINKGADWFNKIGTEGSKGTKVFALVGKIKNSGLAGVPQRASMREISQAVMYSPSLVEVPMGTTLRDIIFGLGGGIKDNKGFKAVQTGGPSGGCITAEHLDTPIDYDNLIKLGSMMGSGGMIVLSDEDCMVNVAKFYLEFTQDESCGKCTSCRIGTKRLMEILERITEGKGKPEDLTMLQELSVVIKDTALCGLGQTAPNPVLSTLKYFASEYEAHVNEKKCPAGVCQRLISYHIVPDKCVGCTACARNCPVKCISGDVKKPHVIDQDKCIKCGVCQSVCKFDAVEKK